MTDHKPRFFNRELSWLEFNQRVLDEARDSTIPVLERLKFLAITASNLDEFFMVRVGGLQTLCERGSQNRDPAGMTPVEQLAAISQRTHQLAREQYDCYVTDLEPLFPQAFIQRLRMDQVTDSQRQFVGEIFREEVFSMLAPLAVTDGELPLLLNRSISICVRLERPIPSSGPSSEYESGVSHPLADSASTETTGSADRVADELRSIGSVPQLEERYVIIPFGRIPMRFVTLPSEGTYSFVLLEEVVEHFVSHFFPEERVLECIAFRITRNADMAIREDQASDLLEEMHQLLTARKESDCVRIEIAEAASPELTGFLQKALEVEDRDVYRISGPLDLTHFFQLADAGVGDQNRYEPQRPGPSPDVNPSERVFDAIARQDVMLYHPYESFEPVVRFIQEAAVDPDVLAIKQTLYRTSRNSPIVDALARAAENGKHVTVIVELKARFDEQRNIEWARSLEQAGVQVFYGVKGLKTHAKLCVVVRREPHGIQRYVHVGTGNYNDTTARLYSDVSLMTCDEEIGADAVSFFNAVTGYSLPQPFLHLAAAPLTMRGRLTEMIDAEIEFRKQNQLASITAKLNSLVDPDIIERLYKASQAGVKVRLNIRGVCCLRPGVPGLSENIEVVSVIDRYLEHARVLHFRHGGDNHVFISSADWMPRNIDRRVELLIPVRNEACRKRLIEIVKSCFRDRIKGRRLRKDGRYVKMKQTADTYELSAQQWLYQDMLRRAEIAQRHWESVFEPVRAGE